MSIMVNPDTIPPWLMERMKDCGSCEADRRPGVSLCNYHVGLWDGWNVATNEMTSRVLGAIRQARGSEQQDNRPDPVALGRGVSGQDIGRGSD